jgi:hypothetical protein
MFLREAPTETLADVREKVSDHTESIQRPAGDLNVVLTGDAPRIEFRDSEQVIPMRDGDSLTALGNWLDVTNKFLHRIDVEMQEQMINHLLRKDPSAAGNFIYSNGGLQIVRNPNQKYFAPERVLERVGNVLPAEAPVVEWRKTTDDFAVDVIVPEGFDRGIGGDPAVGDITRGGIRVGLDLKHGLAPTVQPFSYRLICTNGMETADLGLKVDARGASVEEVLAEFEAIADRAFRRVEADISAFYDLRSERVDNPERTVARIGAERGLPARTIAELVERTPSILDEQGNATMFDVVNLITNAANDPRIRRRINSRRALEQAGGSTVTGHAARCGHCQSALN